MARSTSGESVMERVLRIIEAFDVSTPVLTVSEIARRADLPVTTAHRLVNELVDLRMLERAGPHQIRIGLRMWELSSRSSRVVRLRDVALPFMEDLHAVVRQHTQLGVLDGDEVLYIERLSAPGSMANATYVAGRLPAHACSAGLVLLAFAPADVREEILSQPLARYTPNTVTDPQQLRKIFADIRVQGHCLADSMTIPNAVGAAAPVFDANGDIVAALTIVVPSDADRIVGHIPALMTAARGISRTVGIAGFNLTLPLASDTKFLAIHRKNRR